MKNTPESDGGAVLLLSCNKLVIAVYESTRFRKYTTTPTSVWKQFNYCIYLGIYIVIS